MRKQISMFVFFISAVSFALSGCSSNQNLPSINYSGNNDYNYGQVVWRDLVTPNPKLAAEFYLKVFGWTSQNVGSKDQPYWIFKSNGKPVGGMYLMSEGKKGAGGEWVQYYSVNSLESVIRKSKIAGGQLIIQPVEVPGRGNVALLSDPQNAYFAIIKSDNGDSYISDPPEYDFLWNELWSNDVDKSGEYYKSIFNSQLEIKKDDDRVYTIIKNDNKNSSGIIQNPVENVRSNWVQYVRVSDVRSVEQKARDAGANILIPVDSAIRNGTVSVFTDPTGAPIAIQKWPIE